MKQAKTVEHIPDPIKVAGQTRDLELTLLLAVHDAVADMGEAINCYLIDRYGSMYTARKEAECA